MAVMKAQGITVGIKEDGGVSYTLINCITAVSYEPVESTTIDTTCLNADVKTKTTGLKDNGSFGIEFNIDFEDPGYQLLSSEWTDDNTSSYELTFPLEAGFSTQRVATFSGNVKVLPFSGSIDELVTGSGSIEISGAIVWTPPTPVV